MTRMMRMGWMKGKEYVGKTEWMTGIGGMIGMN